MYGGLLGKCAPVHDTILFLKIYAAFLTMCGHSDETHEPLGTIGFYRYADIGIFSIGKY